eukprot:scaffold1351_cov359-Prasinococcus_capsulatus_cf.AAC.5
MRALAMWHVLCTRAVLSAPRPLCRRLDLRMRVALVRCPLCPPTGSMVFLRRVMSPSVLCMGSERAVLRGFRAAARPS